LTWREKGDPGDVLPHHPLSRRDGPSEDVFPAARATRKGMTLRTDRTDPIGKKGDDPAGCETRGPRRRKVKLTRVKTTTCRSKGYAAGSVTDCFFPFFTSQQWSSYTL
jgi:hypothetical protein